MKCALCPENELKDRFTTPNWASAGVSQVTVAKTSIIPQTKNTIVNSTRENKKFIFLKNTT